MMSITYLTHDEDDRYTFEVVGESHHREQLLHLVSTATPEEQEAGEMYRLMDLLPEPTNTFDPNAIAVYCWAQKVGYVGRNDAGDLRDEMDHAYRAGAERLLVWGVIGWDTNNPAPPIGVRLDLPDEDLTLIEARAEMPAQK